MNEHTVVLTTIFGPVTAEFGRAPLAGRIVATVKTGPGFSVGRHEYSGKIFLTGPGWAEPAAHVIYDTTFTDPDGKHPFPRDRAAMVAAIRAAVAEYAARAAVGR